MEKFETIIKMLCDCSQIITFENSRLLTLSAEIASVKKAWLSKMPLHINVIAISAVGKLKETAHSSILQHLLKHQGILDSFIENIMGLKDADVTIDEVNPAEQNRIDVSIFSKDICIIIENKVNNAGEQQGQIYRYVQCAKANGYDDSQIKVLYLNPRNNDMPSDYSLSDHGEGKVFIPNIIKKNILVKNYAHDIYEWIKDVYRIIPDNELFIKSAVHQYQDYLEEYFELTDKFKPMNEIIRSVISNNLLSDLSDDNDAGFSKRIEKLEAANGNLAQLQNEICWMIKELKKLRYEKTIKPIQRELGLPIKCLEPFKYNDYDYGIEVEINGKKGYFGFGKNYAYENNPPYIGFAFRNDTLTEDERQDLINVLKHLGKDNSGVEKLWPCWCSITDEELLLFPNFVERVKKFTESNENCRLSFVNP